MWKTKYYYYYTLADFLKRQSIYGRYGEKLRIGIAESNLFRDLIRTFFDDPTWTDPVLASAEVNNMFCLQFIPKYWKSYMVRSEFDYDLDTAMEYKDLGQDLFASICEVIRSTYDKYIVLIKAYTAEKDNLLNQVSSTSTVLFNDTPQEGGDFADDEHATNATITTSNSDLGTKVARINEIDRLLRNFYSDWSEEIGNAVVFWSAEL